MTEQPHGTLDDVLALIAKVAKASEGAQYLYRGEPKKYRKVTSSLYRQYSRIASEDFEIDIVQQEILQKARLFTDLTDDREILAQLQHYGYPTNLIDFTTDYNIALFFACDGYPKHGGRIVLVQKPDNLETKPKGPQNRILAQKSVFIEPANGILKPSATVTIPKALKTPILDHLRTFHGISSATVYNDLHGFIKYQKVHESAYAHFFFGITYQTRQQHDEAIVHYSKAIELNSQLAELYNNRGVAFQLTGDLENSMKDLSRAIELNSNSPTAYHNRSSAAQDLGDFNQALQDIDLAVHLEPNSALAHNSRGNLYTFLGKNAEALKDYDRAIELDSDLVIAYSNKGNLLSLLGNCAEAMEVFATALKKEPANPNIWANRGAAHAGCHDYASAIADYTQSISLDPNDALAYLNRGRANLALGNENNSAEAVTEAMVDFDKAIDLEPLYAQAHYMRGVAHKALGDYTHAKEDLYEALELAKDAGLEDLRSLVEDVLTKLGENLQAH